MTRRVPVVALVVLGAVTVVGCDVRGRSSATPPPPRFDADVLCDHSLNGPCTASRLDAIIAVELSRSAQAPGSTLRVWFLGKSAADTTLIFESTSTPSPRSARKKVEEHQRHFVATGREEIQRDAAPFFASRRPAIQSPIAEGITRVVRYGSSTSVPRRILVLSDLRQYGGLLGIDAECGRLPTASQFLTVLHKNQLLTPGSMAGISITCAYVDLPPAGRCQTTLANQAELEALWLTALSVAGAEVRISAGPPERAGTKAMNSKAREAQ